LDDSRNLLVKYVGQPVIFQCRTLVPALWLHSGKKALINSTGVKFKTNGQHWLYIDSVTLSDAGTYTCVETGRPRRRLRKVELLVGGKWILYQRNYSYFI